MLLVCSERMEEIREGFEANKELWLKREKESHCIEDTENIEGFLLNNTITHTLSLYSQVLSIVVVLLYIIIHITGEMEK